MKKFLALLFVFLLVLCGCGTNTTMKVTAESLSGEYEISSLGDESNFDRIVDRIILFPDGKCTLHLYTGSTQMNYTAFYSYDKDSSYIMFSNNSDAFIGLAKYEEDRIVFEQLGNEDRVFTLTKCIKQK